jgi:hypothetical protein
VNLSAVDCTAYSQARQLYFNASTPQEVFRYVAVRQVVDFMKEVGFYRKL